MTGSVPKKLIRFAFPLFLANLLQALYNVVDMLVVGKIVGKTGLAAISNASMLCFIINSLCIGLTMGGSVLVAQCKGANDQTGQRDTIGMLFFLSLVGSAVVTILGLAIYEALFQALNVPANAYQDACGYMKIICCGTVFVFGYNAVCSILKGLGDSQTPLFFVGVATVLNVVLDVLLVGPLSMGTAGAAWATITAQGVSFMGSLVYLRRYQLGFSLTKIEFHREKLLAILKVGLPTAIQMVVVNTAYLLVTGMLNQFGTPVAAASGVGLKINTFAGMHCWAIGQAITAMVGQCLGAGQIERARKVVWSGLLLNLVVTAAVVVVVQLLAEPLICMFDGTSPEVIRCGVQYLRTCCSINSLIYAGCTHWIPLPSAWEQPTWPWSMPCWTPSLCACQWDGCWHFPSLWAFPGSIWARPFRPSCLLLWGWSTLKAGFGKGERRCINRQHRAAETSKRRKRI